MLKLGDKVGFIACSNGLSLSAEQKVSECTEILQTEFGLQVKVSPVLYQEKSACENRTPKKRAKALMQFYLESEIKVIFDLSGGDVANELLPYLDFTVIQAHPKPFVGYSDLTVLLNALYTRTGHTGYNFQLLNILHGRETLDSFREVFLEEKMPTVFHYQWLTSPGLLEAPVIGGNIRCFLKLAGTKYWPPANGHVLLLESQGGEIERVRSYLAQLDQTGLLRDCSGIVLGQFTTIEKQGQKESLEQVVLEYAKSYSLPVLNTSSIGHSKDAIPFPIGRKVCFG